LDFQSVLPKVLGVNSQSRLNCFVDVVPNSTTTIAMALNDMDFRNAEFDFFRKPGIVNITSFKLLENFPTFIGRLTLDFQLGPC